jgi:hypothetical protein
MSDGSVPTVAVTRPSAPFSDMGVTRIAARSEVSNVPWKSLLSVKPSWM